MIGVDRTEQALRRSVTRCAAVVVALLAVASPDRASAQQPTDGERPNLFRAERATTRAYFDSLMALLGQSATGFEFGPGFRGHAALEIGAAETRSGDLAWTGTYGFGYVWDTFGLLFLYQTPAIADTSFDVVAAGLSIHPKYVQFGAEAHIYPHETQLSAGRFWITHDPIYGVAAIGALSIGNREELGDQGWTTTFGALRASLSFDLFGRVNVGANFDRLAGVLTIPIATSLVSLAGVQRLPTTQHGAPWFDLRAKAVFDPRRLGYGIEIGPSVALVSWTASVKHNKRQTEQLGKDTTSNALYLFGCVSYYSFAQLDAGRFLGDDPQENQAIRDLVETGKGLGFEAGIYVDSPDRGKLAAYLDPYHLLVKLSLWYNFPQESVNGTGHLWGVKLKALY